MENTYDDTAGAIGGAIGAVVGIVVASLLPFAPVYLLVAAIIGGVSAYSGYHFVHLFSRHA